MTTVHMIGNAHLDPVWLWRKADGVDAALAAARSACDRLDEYPDFVFTCSGSWFHEVIERLDPALFERVRTQVRAGRWQTVGGMVIQPDCNLPSEESFARQLEVGQAYYRRAFGRPTTVGYNVDSFGHAAYLPRLLGDAGIDCYVFMRPGPHEKSLPANLFRWRSPDGREVAAFRIAGAYCIHADDLRRHVETAIAAMPPGADHTMCFFGVGDHGGGPTKAQIEWVRTHRDDFAGARLVFSHPRAFFDAVAGRLGDLPVVEGELQHHAIGCYSVERRIKVAMRRAEARLVQAGQAVACFGASALPEDRAAVERAWGDVLFNQFHDILGGTCIPESSAAAAAELAAAEAEAHAVITQVTRRALRAEARPGEHRIAVFNPSPEPFNGYVIHEPWGAPDPCTLLDWQDRPVACQAVEPRAKVGNLRQLLFRTTIVAGGHRVFRLVPGSPQPPAANPTEKGRGPFSCLSLEIAGEAIRLADWTLTLDVHDDPTDTWSHSADRSFAGPPVGRFAWDDEWQAVEAGPIRAAMLGQGRFGASRAWLRAMVYEGQPQLHLRLAVVWAEIRRRLSLRVAAPGRLARRLDLVSGGPLERPLDGEEYPLNGAMVVGGPVSEEGTKSLKGTGLLTPFSMAIVAPEVFSVSADERGVGLTLLRSPYAAHHDPYPAGERPDCFVTDQGTHEFDLVLWSGAPVDLAAPSSLARQMLMPPVTWDLTG